MDNDYIEEEPDNGEAEDRYLPDDLGEFEESRSYTPQPMDASTFKQRNDPKELLERIRLDIMNAYVEDVEETDPESGIKRTVRKFKKRKGAEPKANKQGVSDIMSYCERLINSHTVQANIKDLTEYRNRMRHISSDIIMHFLAHREEWGVKMNDSDELVATLVNLFDLFLTRGLDDKERTHYGEGFVERTHRDIRPQAKSNIFQRAGDAISKMFG